MADWFPKPLIFPARVGVQTRARTSSRLRASNRRRDFAIFFVIKKKESRKRRGNVKFWKILKNSRRFHPFFFFFLGSLQNDPWRVLDLHAPGVFDDGLEPSPVHPVQLDDLVAAWVCPPLSHQPFHKLLHVRWEVTSKGKLANGQPQQVAVCQWIIFLQHRLELLHHQFSIPGNTTRRGKVRNRGRETRRKEWRPTCAGQRGVGEGESAADSLGSPWPARGAGSGCRPTPPPAAPQ